MLVGGRAVGAVEICQGHQRARPFGARASGLAGVVVEEISALAIFAKVGVSVSGPHNLPPPARRFFRSLALSRGECSTGRARRRPSAGAGHHAASSAPRLRYALSEWRTESARHPAGDGPFQSGNHDGLSARGSHVGQITFGIPKRLNHL